MCSPTTQRCSTTNPCCHENLLHIFDTVSAIFQENGLRYWLAFGSLLGAVRDGKMIPWDEDIDIGILEADLPKLLKLLPLVRRAGLRPSFPVSIDRSHSLWSVINQRISLGDRQHLFIGSPILLSDTNSLHMDIFVFGHNGEAVWCWEAPKCIQPQADFMDLQTIEFEGRKCPCPSHPEVGLVHYYGEDWKTPKVKKWMERMANKETLSMMEGLERYE